MRPIISVFVVDDQHLVRSCICLALAGLPNIEVVGQTGSAEEALRLCGQLQPQVILLGVKISDPDGQQLALALLQLLPNSKIIIVTSSLDSSLLPQLFKQGISGFFNKGEDQQELLKAIQTVCAGRTYVCPSIAQRMDLAMDELLANPLDRLSERELQVVLLLSYGLKQEDICAKLAINVSTLKTYRARFSEKLRVKNDVELTLLASRHGLLLP